MEFDAKQYIENIEKYRWSAEKIEAVGLSGLSSEDERAIRELFANPKQAEDALYEVQLWCWNAAQKSASSGFFENPEETEETKHDEEHNHINLSAGLLGQAGMGSLPL